MIGLTVCYYAEALFFKGIFSARDLGRYFYPLRFFTVSSIKSGILPLWNPYIFCGTPHMALQQSVIFYPLSIIYYLFPFDLAFNVFLLLHIPLAGFLTYLLCRRWNFGYSASLVGAIMFMLSGYVVSLLNLTTTLSSVVWLPAILLFFDKALCEKSAGYAMVASIFLAVMFLGGEPSIFYSTFWVLLFYAVFFWSSNRPTHSVLETARLFFITGLVAILLSSIQFIPFIELTKFSDRILLRGSYKILTTWSMPLKDTFNFFIPFLARTDFSKESYWREQSWVPFIYVGVFTILLMFMALFLKREWRVKFLLFIGGLFLLVSYGSNTPLYYLVYKFIPGFQLVRYPVRFLYVTTFAIAMLCGAGFDAYVKGRASDDKRLDRFFGPFIFVLFLSAVAFLIMDMYGKDWVIAAYRFFTAHDRKDPELLFGIMAAVKNMGRFAGFFAAGGLVLFLGLRFKIRQAVISFAFISLVVADLFSASPCYQIMLDNNILHASSPNAEYLKKDKSLFRFYVSPKTAETGSFLEGGTYEDAVLNIKCKLLADLPVIDGFYDVGGYDSIQLLSYRKFMMLVTATKSPSETRILDMLNEKYLVSLDKLDAKGYVKVSQESPYLYENKNVLPRAFLTDSFKVMKNERDIFDRLKSKEFDPAKEVILEEQPVLSQMADSKLQMADTAEKVEITKYSLNEVVVKAAINSPKFLVLGDTYYPGWKAYVDGRPDKIYKANYLVRAVYLRPGPHVVRFVFDPFSFRLGAAISLAALIFVLSCIAFKRK